MVVLTTSGARVETESSYDRKGELKAFDDTKAGVKGVVDAGMTQIPRIFYYEGLNHNANNSACNSDFSILIIDLEGISEDSNTSREVIDRVRDASQNGGFFQLINHGIPMNILDAMIDGIQRFHEQDAEAKKKLYSRDLAKRVYYYSTYDLYKTNQPAHWKDSLVCAVAPDPAKPEELPDVCRDIMIEYRNQVMKLADKLSVLLSQALGVGPSHLKDMGCTKHVSLIGHYYPASPQPELTIGSPKHTDPNFITILLQDQVGGLQVLQKDQWVDVPPVRGVLVVNIGDILQLISNGRFKSHYHRVLSKQTGPRISVACFFMPPKVTVNTLQQTGPMKELLSEENPPVHREIKVGDFIMEQLSK